jgi:hypothetical protein
MTTYSQQELIARLRLSAGEISNSSIDWRTKSRAASLMHTAANEIEQLSKVVSDVRIAMSRAK